MVDAGLSQVAFGVSVGSDLEESFSIWDGYSVRDVTINGNYFDSIEMSLDELRKKLMLPDFIELIGQQKRMVQIPIGMVTNPDDLGSAIRGCSEDS